MIKLSGFADEVFMDFKQQLEFLKRIGLKNIELRFLNGENILNISSGKLKEVNSLLSAYGIGVSAIGSPIGKYEIDQPFEPHFDKFKQAVDIALFLGTDLIRVFSYYAPEGKAIEDYRDEVMERMRLKADFLKGSPIVMVHENESHIYGFSAENCADIMETVNAENLALAYDPANFVWGSDIVNNVEVCWPVMKPYVKHVHIKDWKRGSKDVGSLPGEGDGQIEELVKELADMKYSGFVTLEPHMSSGGQFGGQTTPEQYEKALENVKYFCHKYNILCE